MARNAVKWPVTANGRRKVVGDVSRSTGDASDRRRGPAAGAPDAGAPTPNTPSVEELNVVPTPFQCFPEHCWGLWRFRVFLA